MGICKLFDKIIVDILPYTKLIEFELHGKNTVNEML